MDGAGHRFVIAAGRAADEKRFVAGRRVGDVAAKPDGDGAVADEHAFGSIARFAQQLLSDEQLVLELDVAPAQLALKVANGQVRPDAGQHFLGLERFVHEIDSAQFQAAHLVACRSQRR